MKHPLGIDHKNFYTQSECTQAITKYVYVPEKVNMKVLIVFIALLVAVQLVDQTEAAPIDPAMKARFEAFYSGLNELVVPVTVRPLYQKVLRMNKKLLRLASMDELLESGGADVDVFKANLESEESRREIERDCLEFLRQAKQVQARTLHDDDDDNSLRLYLLRNHDSLKQKYRNVENTMHYPMLCYRLLTGSQE